MFEDKANEHEVVSCSSEWGVLFPGTQNEEGVAIVRHGTLPYAGIM